MGEGPTRPEEVAGEPYQDPMGRITNKPLAEDMAYEEKPFRDAALTEKDPFMKKQFELVADASGNAEYRKQTEKIKQAAQFMISALEQTFNSDFTEGDSNIYSQIRDMDIEGLRKLKAELAMEKETWLESQELTSERKYELRNEFWSGFEEKDDHVDVNFGKVMPAVAQYLVEKHGYHPMAARMDSFMDIIDKRIEFLEKQ